MVTNRRTVLVILHDRDNRTRRIPYRAYVEILLISKLYSGVTQQPELSLEPEL